MRHLDQLRIQNPCSASWSEMEGSGGARFCRLCSKTVTDTTSLTTCELEKMLDAPTAPCLRVHRDMRGAIVTRDRLAALAFVGLAACASGGDTAGYADSAETGDVSAYVEGTPTRRMGTGEAERGGMLSRLVQRAIQETVEVTSGEPVYPMLGEPVMVIGQQVAAPDEHAETMGRMAPMMGGVSPPKTGKIRVDEE